MKHLLRCVLFASCIASIGTRVLASCCSSASTSGVGRLLPHERALVELSCGASYLYGSFDEHASFSRGHLSHLPHIKMDNELQIMARLFDFFEPFARVPVRVQKSDIRTKAHLADISLGARIPVFKENAFYNWPSVTIFTSMRLPSGTRFNAQEGTNLEDVTTMGEWLLSLGLMLEKELYGITYGLGYNFSIDPDHQKTIHAPFLTFGYSLHDHGYLSASIAPVFHSYDWARNKIIEDSDRRKLTLGLGYAISVHSHIKLNAQIGSDLPIAYIGKNFNNEFYLRLGTRFGVF